MQDHYAYQFSRTTNVISTQHKFYKLQAALQDQANKPLKNSQPYPSRRQCQFHTHPADKKKHLFYQCHLHQPKKQSLQDHHCTTTVYTTTNNAFQDHLKQQTTTNAHHYCQVHHTNTPCHKAKYQHLQDHIHMHKDS